MADTNYRCISSEKHVKMLICCYEDGKYRTLMVNEAGSVQECLHVYIMKWFSHLHRCNTNKLHHVDLYHRCPMLPDTIYQSAVPRSVKVLMTRLKP